MKTSIINHQISISYSKGDTTVCLGCRPAIDCGTQEMVEVGRELIDIARRVLGDPTVSEAGARKLLQDLRIEFKWEHLQETRQNLKELYLQEVDREKIEYAEVAYEEVIRNIRELESREDVKQARTLLGLPCPPLPRERV